MEMALGQIQEPPPNLPLKGEGPHGGWGGIVHSPLDDSSP